MGSQAVGFLVEGCEIDRLAEPDADGLATGPVAEDLFWQVVAEPGDEDGNDLRAGGVDDLSDAGLGGEHVVRAALEIALPFGVETDDVAMAFGAQLYEPA